MSEITLGPKPHVEEDVVLNGSVLGAYTSVQAHSILNEGTRGDFSYCAGYTSWSGLNVPSGEIGITKS